MPYDAGEIEMLPPRHAAVTLPAYTLVDGIAKCNSHNTCKITGTMAF